MKKLSLNILFFTFLWLLFSNNAFSQQGKVLVIGDHAYTHSYLQDVKSKLSGSGLFENVVAHDRDQGWPNLAALKTYDAVIVWGHDGRFTNEFGDALADYVDQGGGVVVALFSTAYSAASSTRYGVPGRFKTDQYYLISSSSQGNQNGFVKVLPNHELLEGVNTFDAGNFSSRGATIINNSTAVATYSNGDPLIVYNDNIGTGGARRVDLDLFPPSSDARSDFWKTSTDGLRIMTNAIQYVANPIRSTPNPTCITSPTIAFSVNGENITSVSWDFGDNVGTSNQLSTTYTYTSTGAYTVSATVSFSNSIVKTFTKNVRVDALPTVANAGSDQYVLLSSNTATLVGNTPTVGEGSWSKVSGPNTPTQTVSGSSLVLTNLAEGSYVYNYTISNGSCESSVDSVTLNVSTVLPPPTNGLVLHFDPSDSNSYSGSGVTINDLSSSEADGTLTNGVGFSSNLFDFDGSNDFIDVPDGFADFTNGLSIFALVDFGTADNYERIIDFGNGPQSNNILLSRIGTTNDLLFELYNGVGSTGVRATLTNGILNSTLALYTVTLDGTNCKIYRDGALLATVSYPHLPNNVTRTNNYIGKSNWSVDAYFESQMGPIGLYNRVLTADEISKIDAYYDKVYNKPIVNGTASIVSNSISLAGTVKADRGNTVIDRGLVYSTTATPTISDTKVSSGSGIGSYTVSFTPGSASQYYVRAFATNSKGTSYGKLNTIILPQITSFSPSSGGIGQEIVITGTNFTGATAVSIGGVNASSFTIDSDTQITAIVASGASSGNVVVTNQINATKSGFKFKIVELKFENDVLDETGSNKDGVIVGSDYSYSSGADGQSFCFDNTYVGDSNTNAASYTYLKLPNDLIRSLTDFTISIRFKTTDRGGILGYQKGTNAGSTGQYVPILYVMGNGQLSCNLWQGSMLNVTSSAVVNDGNWHKVEFTATAGSIQVYLDGQDIGSSTGTVQHLEMSFNQLGLVNTAGVWPDTGRNGWSPFNGCIDEFIIIDSALTSEEIETVTELPTPTIASFSPTTAGSGDTVTITGTNLSGATAVKFGGTSATITSATSTTLAVSLGYGSSGTVEVTTAAGTVSATGFTYQAVKEVIAPSSENLSESSSSASIGDFVVQGYSTETLIATIKLDGPVGTTFNLPTNTGLTRDTGYNSWTTLSEISFRGTQTAINNALAAMTVNTGSNGGDVVFKVSVSEYNSGYYLSSPTGNFYKYVSQSGVTYSQAKAAAAATTYQGQQGYLATITSQAEQNYLNNNISGSNVWIALSDKGSEGTWYIDAGPENGRVIWKHPNPGPVTSRYSPSGGAAVDGFYTNWDTSEPNNAYGSSGEHHAVAKWNGGSKWNDLYENNSGQAGGYVIEYGDGSNASTDEFDDTYSASVTHKLNIVGGPTDISLSSASVEESNPVGTVIGSFTTSDTTDGDTFTYSLVDPQNNHPDNAAFTISNNQLKTAIVFNRSIKTSYLINVKSVDASGKSFTKEFTLTVVENQGDSTPPTVVTQNITVALDANGQASIQASQIDNGSTDGDSGIASMTLDISTFDCDDAGSVVTVTLTVTDNDGNSATGTAQVTVENNDIDTDSDGLPNNCDSDDDGDGTPDTEDAFPLDPDEDTDTDGDGVGDNEDAFPNDANESKDTDGDGIGDSTDPDIDGDGIPNASDADQDGDGTIDNGPDTDGDGINDANDPDIDGDGILNDADVDPDGDGTNDNGTDLDGDGTNDEYDTDDDNDGVLDVNDAFPLDANETVDTDGDGTGNNADTDDDGDGVLDVNDAFPLDATETVDTDGDGTGNNADTDDDGDGALDVNDAFPLDATETVDTDGDGTGNNADTDDDNDGLTDTEEAELNTNPLLVDTDNDGVIDATEVTDKTNPLNPCSLIVEHQTESVGMTYWDSLDCDNDGVPNGQEVSSTPANSGSRTSILYAFDTDGDGILNYMDADDDGDGVNTIDELLLNSSTGEYSVIDSDQDSIPNYLDSDDDNDGIDTIVETSVDTDGDGTPDYLDSDDDGDGVITALELSFSNTQNPTEFDSDGDGIPNHLDAEDNYEPTIATISVDPNTFVYLDTDGDGIPNMTDSDDDNDGFTDAVEVSCNANPLRIESQPGDYDDDGIADCIDADIDGDGVDNESDLFPLNPFESADNDNDGIGDNVDADDDNDGVIDALDAFPLDPNESADTDGDGIGNNVDNDLYNDGFDDSRLEVSGVLTPNTNGVESTWKITNINLHPLNKVAVYNTNGVEVFATENYDNSWDGTYKGTTRRVPAGSYLYKVYLYDTRETLTGWLYIAY